MCPTTEQYSALVSLQPHNTSQDGDRNALSTHFYVLFILMLILLMCCIIARTKTWNCFSFLDKNPLTLGVRQENTLDGRSILPKAPCIHITLGSNLETLIYQLACFLELGENTQYFWDRLQLYSDSGQDCGYGCESTPMYMIYSSITY